MLHKRIVVALLLLQVLLQCFYFGHSYRLVTTHHRSRVPSECTNYRSAVTVPNGTAHISGRQGSLELSARYRSSNFGRGDGGRRGQLQRRTQTPSLTDSLIVINVIAFLLTMRFPALKLKFMKVDALISRRGQYYRLLSSIFLHGDALHLFCNCYALNNIGPMAQSIFGSSQYALLYLGAGLLANVGTYAAGTSPYALGASGAVFGLLGALLAFFRMNRRAIGPAADAMISNINQNLLINVMYGVSSRNVDNWAHLAGFLSGGVIALAVGPRRNSNRSSSRIRRSNGGRTGKPALRSKEQRPMYFSSSSSKSSSKDSSISNLGSRLRGFLQRLRGGGSGDDSSISISSDYSDSEQDFSDYSDEDEDGN